MGSFKLILPFLCICFELNLAQVGGQGHGQVDMTKFTNIEPLKFKLSTYEQLTKGRNTTAQLMKFCSDYCISKEYTVETRDGYLIILFHMNCADKPVTKGTVLMQPGYTTSSDIYFLKFQDSLPCKLKDAGYDIWIGNFRGNRYGLKHKSLDPNTPEFWQFSIDEMGTYDVPAMIDYVRTQTRNIRILYVGYSMGGSMGLMYGSWQPNAFKERLSAFLIIAPGYIHCNMMSPLRLIPSPALAATAAATGGPLLPDSLLKLLYIWAPSSCNSDPNVVCPLIYGTIAGGILQPSQNVADLLSVYFPDISSAYVLQEILQNKEQCKFQSLDKNPLYPLSLNSTAVQYDVSEIGRTGIPVFVAYGINDSLVTAENMVILCRRLGGNLQCLGYNGTGHLDMVVGSDVHRTVYLDVLSFLDKHTMRIS